MFPLLRIRASWPALLGVAALMSFQGDPASFNRLKSGVEYRIFHLENGRYVQRPAFSPTGDPTYASRIGHRLREAEAASRVAAAEEYGEALLPVLADRSAAVKAAEAEAFPHLVSRSVTISNAAGWAAGAAAADLASLAGRTEVPTSRA
jgi:hypothetical protein